jgi:thioredoxin reductase (NADPH)
MRSEEVLIVGAGPVGLACGVSARQRGMDPLIVDAGAIVNSIAHYPIQMGFFTTPDLLEIGGHPLVCTGQKPVREEAMMYYRGVVRAERLRVQTYTSLLGAMLTADGIVASLAGTGGEEELRCSRLVVATGYYDNPRRLDVPGEALPHVSHYFDEAHHSAGLDVVVVGGKNSAVEAALLLYRAGARVTIVCRKAQIGETVKYWMRPDIENRIKAGEIAARMNSSVKEILPRCVVVSGADGSYERLAADRVYALTGYLPDTGLLRRIGVGIEEVSGRPTHDPATLETNVPGVFLAGSICAGYRTSDIFIENGRLDGERIFTSSPVIR